MVGLEGVMSLPEVGGVSNDDLRVLVVISETSDAAVPPELVGDAPAAAVTIEWVSNAFLYAPQSRKYLSFNCSNV